MTSNRAEGPIQLGQRILAILDAGNFTSTYKYALLLALIDACVEDDVERGQADVVRGRRLAERMLALYWQQARPFHTGHLLRQGNQRDVVHLIATWRSQHPDAGQQLATARAHPDFGALRDEVIQRVIRYPIPLLQVLPKSAGGAEETFLFTIGWSAGRSGGARPDFDDRVYLREGVREALIELSGLLRPVIQREWAAKVAASNKAILPSEQIEEHLFGIDRTALIVPRRLLTTVARNEGVALSCFWCERDLGSRTMHIDHVIPWKRWPSNDLANLVMADSRCNVSKQAMLVDTELLGRWQRRNTQWAGRLQAVAAEQRWPFDPERVRDVAWGVYRSLPDGTPLWSGDGVPAQPASRVAMLRALGPSTGSASEAAEDEPPYEAR